MSLSSKKSDSFHFKSKIDNSKSLYEKKVLWESNKDSSLFILQLAKAKWP